MGIDYQSSSRATIPPKREWRNSSGNGAFPCLTLGNEAEDELPEQQLKCVRELYHIMDEETELQEVLLRLLHGIREGDIEIYKELVDPELTCFEPESQGHGVRGLSFHFFFMEHTTNSSSYHLELVDPTIKVYGATGYAAYTLLIQKNGDQGVEISSVNETRIFRRIDGTWKMVHFHRS
jgi:calcium/calmodulin-dependent protein kinase (CaM kinase) II